MRSPAEANKALCDEMLELLEEQGLQVDYSSLTERTIVSTDEKELQHAMDWLTCSFSFTAKQIFVDNAFGYRIELPRIIIDEYDLSTYELIEVQETRA